MLASTGRFTIAMLVGALGGAAFYALGLPLPWTLGAMVASAVVSIAGHDFGVPLSVRDFARPVVGVMAGSAFSPAVIASLAAWWPAILVMLGYTLVTIFLGGLFFRKLVGLDRTTAFFASSPGGLAELTLLGGSLGGDLRSLVLIHSMRVVVTVFSAPFIVQFLSGLPVDRSKAVVAHATAMGITDGVILLACAVLGFLIGRRYRIPGGVMIPALVLSAIVHSLDLTASSPPDWLVAAVQVVIGSLAGSRFSGVRWAEMTKTMVGGFVWCLVLIAGAVVSAEICTLFLEPPAAALALAFMPGGMAEMTLIAYAIGFEVAFVVTCQVCRITFVFIISPVLYNQLSRAGAESPAAGKGKNKAGKG
ncbi:AbrB family transcriptional regulator [Agaricicola taiwanensis]|uniref:AbrB family transcriptional regulator n=1 Tax=Agaricicola taiwanensis TaxID=591372 RepID=UPI001E654995|nr:AbrB family transcriptional regulator [Agaricicola taiwanensis]